MTFYEAIKIESEKLGNITAIDILYRGDVVHLNHLKKIMYERFKDVPKSIIDNRYEKNLYRKLMNNNDMIMNVSTILKFTDSDRVEKFKRELLMDILIFELEIFKFHYEYNVKLEFENKKVYNSLLKDKK